MTTESDRLFGPDQCDPKLLLSYQANWIADKSTFKAGEKSRRVGLTWAEAADNSLTAATRRSDGGRNVYYSGYNKDMSLEYIQTCASWAKAFGRAASDIDESEEVFESDNDSQHIHAYNIWFNSKFRICALSSRPSNFRGRQGDVVLDEAAIHCDLPGMLKAAKALAIWGGRIRVISTHLGADNPFAQLCDDLRTGRETGSLHKITFRDAVAQGLARRVAYVTGKPYTPEFEQQFVADIYALYRANAAEELDVIPSATSGTYLTRAQILQTQDPTAPVVRISRPADWSLLPPSQRTQEIADWCEMHLAPILAQLPRSARHWYGFDFARKVHKSSMWVLTEDGTRRSRCGLVLEMSRMPYDQQLQIAAYIVRRLPRWCGGAHDEGGNGGWISEKMVELFGAARILLVNLSQRWYSDNMPRMRMAIEDVATTTPDDPDILGDLRSIKVEAGVPKPDAVEAVGADGEKRHGDSAVSLCLGLYAIEHAPGHSVDWASAGPRGGVVTQALHLDLDRGFGTVRGDLEEMDGYGY